MPNAPGLGDHDVRLRECRDHLGQQRRVRKAGVVGGGETLLLKMPHELLRGVDRGEHRPADPYLLTHGFPHFQGSRITLPH